MINLKTPEQINILKKGGYYLANILQKLKLASKDRVSTLEIEHLADRLIKDVGAEPSFKGFKDYPSSVCISLNDEVVHGIPSKRRFRKGDLVSLDLGLKFQALYTDAAISFVVGKAPTSLQKKIMEVTLRALNEGIKQIKPGRRLGYISAKIEEIAKKAGFCVIYNLVGHGVGFAVHEEPPVPNFGEKQLGPKLKVGMVIAIEPMVSVSSHQVKIDNDGWTARSKDGSLSCHFEHTVAVTKSGFEVLTIDKKTKFC